MPESSTVESRTHALRWGQTEFHANGFGLLASASGELSKGFWQSNLTDLSTRKEHRCRRDGLHRMASRWRLGEPKPAADLVVSFNAQEKYTGIYGSPLFRMRS